MARPRKPTAIKDANGAHDLHPERRPKNEPVPAEGAPVMPKDLNAKAKKKWKWLADTLSHMRVLSQADGDILERYCRAYQINLCAEAIVKQEGVVLTSASGNPSTHPAFRAWAQTHDQLVRILTELGLTPASRSKVEAVPTSKENDEKWTDFAKVAG